MIRTLGSWTTIVAIASVLAGTGCKHEVEAAPPKGPRPQDQPPAPPGTPKAPQLELPKPGPICNSPFAIVESERATCEEGLGGVWKLVTRPVRTAQSGTDYDQNKNPGQTQDKKKQGAIKPGDASKPPLAAPNDARRGAPGSAPFCVYKWAGKDRPTPDQFAAIRGTQECGLTVGLGVAEDVAARAIFNKNFDRQVRAFASELPPAFSAQLEKAKAKAPIVAVVDASPWGVTKLDVSGHGYAISRIIGHLACVGGADAPDCKDFVKPYLALPLVPKTGSPGEWEPGSNGGFMGYFHDLFDAFEQALDERPRDRNLIVNLSLGWDPTTTSPRGPEVRHMRSLLERAHCEGVLVVAAAGNGTGAEKAPVFPAALEAVGPNARRCKELLVPNPKPPKGAYAPLVHAVGSVDLYDERLPTVRAWAHPRLATYGTAVTVPGPVKGEFLPPRTGTSVSTGSIAALASVLWGLKPGIDAAQVMKAVYDGGIPLETKNRGSRTEVCLDTGDNRCHTWPARRATLCGALNAFGIGRKFSCVSPVHPKRNDPSTSATYFPPRPTEPLTPPNVNAPCDTTNCNVPIGANPVQGPALVGPMGVATCGGCTLILNGGNGLLTGLMSNPPPFFFTTVILYDSYWAPHYYYPFQLSTPNGWFWQGMPAGSTHDVIAAEIDWTYYSWGAWWTDAASLLIAP